MNCPDCDRDNDRRRRFCGDCGAVLAVVCGRCGFANEPRDRFCGGCRDRLRSVGRDTAEVRSLPPVDPGLQPIPPSALRFVAVDDPADEDDDIATIGEEALARLLADSAEEADAAVLELPEKRVTQDELDRLFGGES